MSMTRDLRDAVGSSRPSDALGGLLALAGLVAGVYDVGKGISQLVDTAVTVHQVPIAVGPKAAGPGWTWPVALGTVEVPGAPLGTRLAVAAGYLVCGVILLVAVPAVLGLVVSVGRGDAFTAANERRLWTVSGLCVAWAVLLPLAEQLGRAAVLPSGGPTPSSGGLDGAVVPLAGALLTAALASAFRRGRQLEHDVDGLV